MSYNRYSKSSATSKTGSDRSNRSNAYGRNAPNSQKNDDVYRPSSLPTSTSQPSLSKDMTVGAVSKSKEISPKAREVSPKSQTEVEDSRSSSLASKVAIFAKLSVAKVEQTKVEQTNVCILCRGDHKFSIYNITSETNLHSNQPIMYYDSKANAYRVGTHKTISQEQLSTFRPITNELIENSQYTDTNVVYWGNGKTMFVRDDSSKRSTIIPDNSLAKLLASNMTRVDLETISNLANYIHCPSWWNQFYGVIGDHNVPILSENIGSNLCEELLYKVRDSFPLLMEKIQMISTNSDKTFV